MATLRKRTPAILIHGITRQQVCETSLDAGTVYEDYARWTDGVGTRWKRITVRDQDGQVWLYDILPLTKDD